MKTSKLFAFFVLMLVTFPSFAQERGFFRIYPLDDLQNSEWSLWSVETEDGGLVVAIDQGNGGHGVPGGKLYKLSDEGEILNSVPFGSDTSFYSIGQFFRHPQDPHTYIGTGTKSTYYMTNPFFDMYRYVPYFIYFDKDLNITYEKVSEWPEDEYQNPLEGGGGYTLTHDGKFFGYYTFTLPTDPSWSVYHRVFVETSLEGDLERFVLDSTYESHHYSTLALFEYPDSYQKGMLGSFGEHGYYNLFQFDKDWQPFPIIEYHCLYTDTTIHYNPYYLETYYAYWLEGGGTNVLPLDDSTLMFTLRADETAYRYFNSDSSVFINDLAPILFKTDLEGNMRDILIMNRLNDTLDTTPYTSTVLTEPDEQGRRYIYHCSFSRTENYCSWCPNTMAISKLTEDFNILWRKSYALYNTSHQPYQLLATSDGGCIVMGLLNEGDLYTPEYFWFVLKLEADGTVGSDEIDVKDEIFFYPNPVKDKLHLLCPAEMQPIQVALYDLQGRLVRTQNKDLESLSLQGLSAGTYTMRVTMEDGKVFSDKVVKE